MLNLGNLGDGEPFLVVEGEEQVQGWGKRHQHFLDGIPLLLLGQPHFHIFFADRFSVQRGEERGYVFVVAIGVLA